MLKKLKYVPLEKNIRLLGSISVVLAPIVQAILSLGLTDRVCNGTVSIENSVAGKHVNLKPWKNIPGPTSLPIVGQLHHFLPGGSLSKLSGYELMSWLYNKYGKIIKLEAILKPTVIALYDAECISEVLRGENWMPVRPGFFSLEYFRRHHNRTEEESLRPAGLAIDQGAQWRSFRTQVNPVMMQPKTIRLYSNVIDDVAGDMVTRFKLIRNENNMIPENLDSEFSICALEAISAVALGDRLNCLNTPLTEDSNVMKLIKSTQELFDISDKLDYKPSIWKYYPTKTFKRAMEVYSDIESVTKHYVSIAAEKYKRNGKQVNSVGEKSVLEKLLEINEDVANVMANDMLIAGVDTTSNTMLGTLYLLATNREKQEKLRKDLAAGRHQYLKACIRESMRMLPVVGVGFRETTKEYNMLGYKIPKGMGILFCHHVLCMEESNFPNAKQYIPERWLVENDDPLHYSNAHPFTYMPFGFGVRTCIGRRIAELEVEIFLKRIIENFDLKWVGAPIQINSSHVNHVQGPYNFVFNDVK